MLELNQAPEHEGNQGSNAISNSNRGGRGNNGVQCLGLLVSVVVVDVRSLVELYGQATTRRGSH